MDQSLFFILLFVVLVGGGAYRWWTRRQQLETAEAYTRAQGWEWRDRDDSVVEPLAGEPFVHSGSSGSAEAVIVGEYRGRPFTSFEYTYTVTDGTDNDRNTYRYAVWILGLPTQVPDFWVRREGWLGGRFAELVGRGDIELGDPNLDKRFRVTSEDPGFAADALSPELKNLLTGMHGDWAWRFGQGLMIAYEAGERNPEHITSRLEAMGAVISAVPADVWSTYGTPVSP